ncbi:MAG: hypothetical protein AAF998_13790 [Bacteroidota bacterium]
MTPLFKKLNFKGQRPIAILRAPAEFFPEMEAMRAFTDLHSEAQPGFEYGFYLVFVQDAAELAEAGRQLDGRLGEDAVLWLAYPKKSSKKYKSDLARDSAEWQVLGEQGFEGVRQVAIDADWSALRFREVNFIKTLKRDPKRAMSRGGKSRTESQYP